MRASIILLGLAVAILASVYPKYQGSGGQVNEKSVKEESYERKYLHCRRDDRRFFCGTARRLGYGTNDTGHFYGGELYHRTNLRSVGQIQTQQDRMAQFKSRVVRACEKPLCLLLLWYKLLLLTYAKNTLRTTSFFYRIKQ